MLRLLPHGCCVFYMPWISAVPPVDPGFLASSLNNPPSPFSWEHFQLSHTVCIFSLLTEQCDNAGQNKRRNYSI